jgi:polysaccharide export outer membrane protein
MRTLFHLKIVVVACLVIVLTMPGICAAKSDEVPSKELVQYVHEAKRRGLADGKIKKQAIAAGWPEAAVDEAIADDRNANGLPVNTASSAKPEAQPETAPPVPELPPSAASPKRVGPPASPAGPRGLSQAPDEYLIGSGDTLQVSVWKEPEASVPSVVVRPDGRITMPLIKEVEVAGLTPRQAEAVITERIAKFIAEPNVSVVVAAINSKKVYLIGAVRKEGALPYTYRMTVMQALSEAGGLNDYAKRRKIYVLRSENGKEYRLNFNYEEVIRGKRMEQNGVLLPGDTVVVPQ